jgi:hypothetical protein
MKEIPSSTQNKTNTKTEEDGSPTPTIIKAEDQVADSTVTTTSKNNKRTDPGRPNSAHSKNSKLTCSAAAP